MNRFRFSIRTLCIVVTLAAIVCALAFRWEPFRSRRLLAQLRSAGLVEVWFDPAWRGDRDGLPTIYMTVVSYTQMDRVRAALPFDCVVQMNARWNGEGGAPTAWAKEICQVENRATLDLEYEGTTDLDIASLATMKRLESLKVQSTNITDKSIAHFKSMPSLRRLELINTKITPAGIEALKEAGLEVHVESWVKDPGL